MRENSNMFDCPCCGNPLIKSDRDRIKCKYCETIIVPRGNKENKFREPVIYTKKRK